MHARAVIAMGFTSLAEFESLVNALAEEGILSDVLPGMIEAIVEYARAEGALAAQKSSSSRSSDFFLYPG